MDKLHFTLVMRYKIILKNGMEKELDLRPEECYFFHNQETKYLISALRNQQDLDINDVVRIEPCFVPQATEDPVEICIGL